MGLDFRPRSSPARLIYDALVAEQEKRSERSIDEWVEAEKSAVWRASRDYAQQNRLPVPSIEDIEKAEMLACGHFDYAAQWAYAVAELLRTPTPQEP